MNPLTLKSEPDGSRIVNRGGMMSRSEEDSDREDRIYDEIVVDAYNEYEKAMSWYCYLTDQLNFPFKAKCIAAMRKSPIEMGEKIEVVAMSPEPECDKAMYGNVRWQGQTLSVPLAQLEGINTDKESREAIEDWHYWVGRGYLF